MHRYVLEAGTMEREGRRITLKRPSALCYQNTTNGSKCRTERAAEDIGGAARLSRQAPGGLPSGGGRGSSFDSLAAGPPSGRPTLDVYRVFVLSSLSIRQSRECLPSRLSARSVTSSRDGFMTASKTLLMSDLSLMDGGRLRCAYSSSTEDRS